MIATARSYNFMKKLSFLPKLIFKSETGVTRVVIIEFINQLTRMDFIYIYCHISIFKYFDLEESPTFSISKT